MNATSTTVTPIHVADLHVEGEVMPVYVHVIDHFQGRVLVDTGMTELHPAVVAAFEPRLMPLSEQTSTSPASTWSSTRTCMQTTAAATTCSPASRSTSSVASSRMPTATPTTFREWVDAPGVQYVPVDGELELLSGVRLVPAPGHTPGTQLVVVETGGVQS